MNSEAKYWEEYDEIKRSVRSYAYCLRLEDKRNRSKQKSRQGKFESSMLSLDLHRETVQEDSDFQTSWESDHGNGAEAIVRHCDRVSTSKDGNDRNAILKRARMRIRRHAPEALETFNLIVRNGSNRRESIRTLAKSRDATKLDSAKRRYWHNMKKLENIFSTP